MKEVDVLVSLDIDGVLIDSTPCIVEFNNDFFGTKVALEDYSENWDLLP